MKDEKLKKKLEEIARLKIAMNLPLKSLPKIGDVSHIKLEDAPPRSMMPKPKSEN
ncbi:MAG TPA: hypothetical protein VL443_25060 [Cyclobacteriaceae bacterium]|jgi:hypothetical protein|nr:hypothetical protein [Cyclobacteriaceae bacterium]